MDANLVGIHITIFSFILMVLLWLLQFQHDKNKQKQEFQRVQLALLNRRNKCFYVFRLFYSQLLRDGECEDIVQFNVPSKIKMIELGYNQLFSKTLTKLIDDFISDAITHKLRERHNKYDEANKLFDTFINRIKIIEELFNEESRVIV